MADKEFNMEELRKELQEAVKDAFGTDEMPKTESDGPLPDAGATREYPLDEIRAAAGAGTEGHTPEATNTSEEPAAAPLKDGAGETDTPGEAVTPDQPEEAGAPEKETPAEESAPGTAEEAAGTVPDEAEEIVAVTTEPLKAEMYEDIEAAKEEARQAEAVASQMTDAENTAAPEMQTREKAPVPANAAGVEEREGSVSAAFDREAIAKAVMASQEKVALETEEKALREVKKKKKRAKARRTARNLVLTLLLLALVAGIAGGAYYYMVRYYSTRFLTGTYINGKDVSGMTAAEVKKDLFGVTDTYTLTIHERGGKTEELTSKQLGRSYIDNTQVETIMEEQENEKWLFHMSDEKVYEVTFDMAYDKKMASDAIDRLQCFVGPDITAPRDAKLSTNPDGTYVVQPEEQGNTLDEAKAKALIVEALDNAAADVDFEAEDCYLKPEVLSTDERLNKRVNDWNAYLSVNVTYVFGNQTETVNAETVRPYITDNGYDVFLATDWVKTLVYAWGQKYDTFGLEREFTTHDGVTIKIPAGGDYGWCINKEKTIEDVTDCILNGVTGEREPIWLFKAMGWDNNDITGTYCEVSIQDQHLWCYKDGVCVMETDVVTGKPTAERMTFTGCFAIDGKKKDATLGRLDVQGYASPVSWWLPFNGGEGLHDAPWRSNFGGDIYKSNGSHGCVNIPEEKMETIFNALEIGNAVIVYDDKTPVASSEDTVQAENAGEAEGEGN